MPFGYDESSPADTGSIPAFPANERAFRATVKSAIGVEHDDASGRHTFGYGDATARDAITDWADGAVWFLEEGSSYKQQMYETLLGGWVDTRPPAAFANRTEAGAWSAPQYATTATIIPGAGTPNTIAVSAAASPHRKVTLTANSILSNPTFFASSASSMLVLEVHQDGTGGRTLTFGTSYIFAGGVAPIISTTASSISLIFIMRMDSGTFFLSCAPDVKIP